ncbi:FAD-dependent oxidoreductase [Epidermidibacterium keratini]|uniref:FAD-dependent oxidoreductase n=1 Tax=Epidermidibacterium keratini TaxID=1891644 RepID=A0A7L4YJ68_9ACTN|nr:FAD-dependent oxidoreductase [Epidermidibacterium keratini]QHB99295.1 FAD-dependent oxidoreductase [Epidermidibacterium keratini]
MDASELKDQYDYVIVGAGVAGAAAVKGIRDVDSNGSVAVLGAEPDEPVYRPDLSKKLWLEDDAKVDDSKLGVPDGVEFVTSTPVEAIDTDAHQVSAGGKQVGYGKLLIATGGSPRTIDLPDDDRVIYYRTLADYRRLRDLTPEGSTATVIGGGFIGSELASALAQNGVGVTWIMPEDKVQQAIFPPDLADQLTTKYADNNVTLRTGQLVTGGRIDGPSVTVQTDKGDEVTSDVVVVGAGITAADRLADAAGIEVDEGIVVDQTLQTTAPDVYAAGDVVRYQDPLLGRRRVEHVDNAEHMGERAGRNMAGESDPYDYTPFFWSDLFDAGYEAIGDLSSKREMVEDWNEAHDAGVVYYLGDKGAVVGVLLWNVWDSVDKAREVMAKSKDGSLGRDDLIGAIPLG